MANLKGLLTSGRLVEIAFNKSEIVHIGIVTNQGFVKTQCGNYSIPYMKDDLECTCYKVTKVFEYSDGGLVKLWDREYYVDWSTVAVDTKVLVRDSEEFPWKRRYFARFKDGKVYAYNGGNTSFTTNDTLEWNYAKLYKEEEQ